MLWRPGGRGLEPFEMRYLECSKVPARQAIVLGQLGSQD
jgi:hypothetical protein